MSQISMLHADLAELHALDGKFGGGDLVKIAEGRYRKIREALASCTYGEQVGRALYSAAGEFATSTGWVAYDLGQTDRARGYWSTSIDAARTAQDGPLLSLTLTYLSYLATEQGDPQHAWQLLDQAGRHVRTREHAAARAWISARQAEEAATLGDGGALVLLDWAMTVMDYAEPEAGRAWVRFFDNARLGALAVSTYGRLGHPDLAPAADAVLDSVRDDAKTQAVILGDVATAHVRGGDLDQGCALAEQALQVTVRTEATLGRQRLKTLAPMLDTAGTTTASQLSARITAAT